MTDRPRSPLPGGYPQPPEEDHGPEPQPVARALPRSAYTSWIARVLAWVIDMIPYAVLFGIGWGLLLGTRETACFTDTSEYDIGPFCSTGASTVGQIGFGIAAFAALVYLVWNYGYRQGRTGSSIGKSVLKFKVVSEKSGQPIGFGMSTVRQVAHLVDAIACYIGFLFPLWDTKRQTLADKVMTTVCLPR